ncbi:MAG: DUF4919 domain-containing protein [Duncaniella sp.]|nr:DUF4919 domain-containing protein [Duncaniella sp.]
MHKFLILIISLIVSNIAVIAQSSLDFKREKPDLELIKKETLDKSSPYYYPRLMKEFHRNDTLMQLDKYRYLYLGYMFQEDYNPYRSSQQNIQYNVLDKSTKLTRQECDSVIADTQKALADNPFNLGEMVMLINALREKGKTNLANIWQYKLNHLLMAIASTGTGEDEENAWYVIEPQHEYVLLNMMDLTVTDHLFYDPYYEYITVSDKEGKKRGGYYFNIKTLLEEYYRKHPEEL